MKHKVNKTIITGTKGTRGESIEAKVRRIVSNKEPIADGAPVIYTDRKDGVQPAYNIRSDRWDIAIDAMDTAAKAHIAKREGKVVDMNKPKDDISGAEPLQTTT